MHCRDSLTRNDLPAGVIEGQLIRPAKLRFVGGDYWPEGGDKKLIAILLQIEMCGWPY